ncbi:hypothetical protein Ciccas_011155, partial [Cichlidogyrus casuarinus]
VCFVGPRLLPFTKASGLFFILYQTGEDSLVFRFFKCAPILCLMIFILSHSSFKILPRAESVKNLYMKRIFCGLLFSMIGDFFIVSRSHLIYGILFFAISHLWYISAFGWSVISLLSIPLSLLCLAVYFEYIFAAMSPVLFIFSLTYMFIILNMFCCALIRSYKEFPLYKWNSICRVLGATFFLISDTVLCFDLFSQFNIPYAHYIIMMTYYTSQLFISLSVTHLDEDCKLKYR